MKLPLQKVLVVEDSQLLQKGYELIFRRYKTTGCQVLHALNGREGLDALSENPDCDLIILDLNMPQMTGPQFLECCKRHSVYSRIPVIIVSTEGEEASILCGLKAGADAYLVKPFAVDELHNLITKLFAERRAAAR